MSWAAAGPASDPAAIRAKRKTTLRGVRRRLTKTTLGGQAARPSRLRDSRSWSWAPGRLAGPAVQRAGPAAMAVARAAAPRSSARRQGGAGRPPGVVPSRRDWPLRSGRRCGRRRRGRWRKRRRWRSGAFGRRRAHRRRLGRLLGGLRPERLSRLRRLRRPQRTRQDRFTRRLAARHHALGTGLHSWFAARLHPRFAAQLVALVRPRLRAKSGQGLRCKTRHRLAPLGHLAPRLVAPLGHRRHRAAAVVAERWALRTGRQLRHRLHRRLGMIEAIGLGRLLGPELRVRQWRNPRRRRFGSEAGTLRDLLARRARHERCSIRRRCQSGRRSSADARRCHGAPAPGGGVHPQPRHRSRQGAACVRDSPWCRDDCPRIAAPARRRAKSAPARPRTRK